MSFFQFLTGMDIYARLTRKTPLTLLHSDWPKLYTSLAFLSAIRLKTTVFFPEGKPLLKGGSLKGKNLLSKESIFFPLKVAP